MEGKKGRHGARVVVAGDSVIRRFVSVHHYSTMEYNIPPDLCAEKGENDVSDAKGREVRPASVVVDRGHIEGRFIPSGVVTL